LGDQVTITIDLEVTRPSLSAGTQYRSIGRLALLPVRPIA
jgi:hypothetical protein